VSLGDWKRFSYPVTWLEAPSWSSGVVYNFLSNSSCNVVHPSDIVCFVVSLLVVPISPRLSRNVPPHVRAHS
jgi:hypothetical protein